MPMLSLFDKIRFNGINEKVPERLRVNIELTNVLIAFLTIVGIFLQFTVFRKTRFSFNIIFIAYAIYFISFLLVRFGKYVIARLFLSIGISAFVFFASALIYNRPTEGVVAKLLLASLLILPFVLFDLSEWFYMLIATIFNGLMLLRYDKINDLLNYKDLGFNFDNPQYNTYGIFTSMVLIIAIVLYYKFLLYRINDSLVHTNESLINARNKIFLQNQELQALNDSTTEQKFELERQNTFLNAVISNANDAIVIVDDEGRVMRWNKVAEKLFGFTEREVLNKKIIDLIVPKDRKDQLMVNFVESGTPFGSNVKDVELTRITKDNKLLDLSASVASVEILSKKYSIIIMRDISEKKEFIRKLKKQKQIAEYNYDQIHQSLEYAELLQRKLLPSLKILENYFQDYFLLYIARDMVSGDFYYIKELKDRLIVAVGDCTGHGAPGGLLSVLSISFLNQIINEDTSPAEILNQLRDKIKDSINSESNRAYDGLDIGLCEYRPATRTLTFAGAYISMYIVDENGLEQIKGDRMPIGIYLTEKKFTQKTVQVKEDQMIYIATDGYTDQIGGPKSKKFTTRRFKELLADIYDLPCIAQKEALKKNYLHWKQDEMQIDDITVIGLRI